MPESTWSDLLVAHEQARRPRPGGAPEHLPKAAVLTCADARVEPTRIFGTEPGSLFTLRTPGHVLSSVVLAGLDLAVAELGVDLVIVLGHTQCAAVGAAANGADEPHLMPVVAEIAPVVAANPNDDTDHLVARHAVKTALELAAHDGPLGRGARAGSIAIHAAVYDLATAHLTEIPIPSPNPTT